VEEQPQTPGKKRERVVKTLSKIGSIVWQLRAKPSETVTKLRSKVAENVFPKVEQGVNRYIYIYIIYIYVCIYTLYVYIYIYIYIYICIYI
jgi:hypothetical protein